MQRKWRHTIDFWQGCTCNMYLQCAVKTFFVLDGRSGNLAIGVKNVVCCWKNIIGMRRNRDVCWKR